MASQPHKNRPPWPAGRSLQIPALSHRHRLWQKGTRLTSRNVSARGEEVTPASPVRPARRFPGHAWDRPPASPPAACRWRRRKRQGEEGRNGGLGPGAVRCRTGSPTGPGTWDFPQVYPLGRCRRRSVTHSDRPARTKATATAQLEGLRTSWASSAALRHATGTSWATRPGTSGPKREGVYGDRPPSGPWAPCNGCPQRAGAARGGGGERERPRPAPPGAARRRRGDSAPPRPGAHARSGFEALRRAPGSERPEARATSGAVRAGVWRDSAAPRRLGV